MRRRLLFPILFLSVALVAAGCGDDDEGEQATTGTTAAPLAPPSFPAGTTMATIQQRGKLVVGVKYDQPGFGQRNPTNNQIEGFDVEIGKLMGVGIFGGTVSDLGPKVEFVEAISRNREPFIQNGTVDIVIATYTISDARKQVVDFAGPYFIARQDMMVKSTDNSIRSVTDLNGKRVCTAAGSTSERNLRAQAPQAELLLFGGYSECAQALTDGRVVAVSTDAPILAGLVQQSGGAFKLVRAPFSDEPYGIGLKKGDDAFRAFLNDRLEAIYASGEWVKAFNDTLGRIGLDLPTPPPVDRYSSAVAGTTTTSASGTTTTGAGSATTTTTRP
ncbi:MAG TPA: glutamate ABC transporter substrate-binding protein [Acidimicrobiales bacterium]|jgi:glutamate transport system substrate-binding protein|nr:glutamate ABC transporter substrate-binding protein [Acidimicrobiales bacterium]